MSGLKSHRDQVLMFSFHGPHFFMDAREANFLGYQIKVIFLLNLLMILAYINFKLVSSLVKLEELTACF